MDDTRQQVSDQPAFDLKQVEERLKSVRSLKDLTGQDGVLQEMLKGTIERLLQAEQEAHLGYEPYKKQGKSPGNSRNGYSKKRLKTTEGELEIHVPRDRAGTFEPKFIEKYQTIDPDLERRVIGMYARDMSVRDIQSQLKEFYYGTEISPALISRITDQVLEAAEQWQARPLDDVYAVVFLDAIHYKIRQDSKVVTKAAYTCLGIGLDGKVEVLGIWIGENEGAHFWLSVLTELKARGIRDILIACIDGLKGFPEAIGSIFPKTLIQLCIVHQIRSSLRYVSYRNQREFMTDLKAVYRAPGIEAAEAALARLEEKWSSRYPTAIAGWRGQWTNLTTYFSFPEEIRRMIYTTNGVEALHRQFRKLTKAKGAFPTDDALRKMLYLTTIDLKGAFRQKQGWPQMLGQLKIAFGDRIPELALR